MIRRILIAFVPGVVGSLIAYWATSSWSDLELATRVFIGFVVGAAVLATVVYLLRGETEERGGNTVSRVLSRIKGREGVRVKDVDVDDVGGHCNEVLSDLESKKGKIDISDVHIGRNPGLRNGSNDDKRD